MKKFLIPILALVFLISAFAKADDFSKLNDQQIESLVKSCRDSSYVVKLNDAKLILSVFNREITVQQNAVVSGSGPEYVLRVKPSSPERFAEVQHNLISMLKFNREYIQYTECDVVFQPASPSAPQ